MQHGREIFEHGTGGRGTKTGTVLNMTVLNDHAKQSANELLKEKNPTLAGNIAQTLADPQADRFVEDDTQFLKFHGIYQQDDRDLRKTGKKYMPPPAPLPARWR